ncbi:uncharacterized protein LOC110876247 [Helianthus annuus]|uniref:uncharacterized protein LOC110876247 n=1 Tax=Helianthus annuus TaxID=4232 RepID=UPI000B8EF17E|nr:uncharacterized protein LOC110876247 [Helianthus annuus]
MVQSTSNPDTAQERLELVECYRLIQAQSLVDSADKWAWHDIGPIEFSVQEAKKWIVDARCASLNAGPEFSWCKWLPLKCNVFMWRTLLDRIPTKVALSSRNVLHGDSTCDLCRIEEESVDHVFTGCGLAIGTWQGIASWVKIPPIFLFSVKDIVEVVKGTGWSSRKKELLYGIFIVTCWRIWKARNERIFVQKTRSAVELVADVKSLSYLWLRSRNGTSGVDWQGWKSFDFDIM